MDHRLCGECLNFVRHDESRCPFCGRDIRPPAWGARAAGAAALVGVGLALAACGGATVGGPEGDTGGTPNTGGYGIAGVYGTPPVGGYGAGGMGGVYGTPPLVGGWPGTGGVSGPVYVDAATPCVAETDAAFCGTTAVAWPDVSALAPKNNEVAGWVGDETNPTTAGITKVARTYADAVSLIDGSSDPFFSSTVQAKALACQTYVNTGNPAVTIDLKVWQLASTADCATVYANLMTYPTYSGQPWVDIALGDQARIATFVAVRVNVCKRAYLIEAALYGDSSATGKNALVAFVNTILAKIP